MTWSPGHSLLNHQARTMLPDRKRVIFILDFLVTVLEKVREIGKINVNMFHLIQYFKDTI